MWFNQPADRRILAWREWRNQLEDLSAEQAVWQTAATWAKVPVVAHYLTPDQYTQWPNPWQLITDDIYCDLAISLGMFYSLAMVKSLKSIDLTLDIYRGPDGWVNLSSVDQGKYVLNYNYGTVVNSSCMDNQKLNLVYSYSKIDLCSKLN